MTEAASLPPVDENEQLARFVLHSNRIRADRTVRPEAFIPHPQPGLSMTRHAGITESEIWELGIALAGGLAKELYGRADVVARDITKHNLSIIPTVEPRNHVNIIGWPVDKPAQKIIAMEIALNARFQPKPA